MVSVAKAPTRYRYEKNIKAKEFYRGGVSFLCRYKTNVVTSNIPKRLGPGCSKLTTSLGTVSLNFEKLISQICQYFC